MVYFLLWCPNIYTLKLCYPLNQRTGFGVNKWRLINLVWFDFLSAGYLHPAASTFNYTVKSSSSLKHWLKHFSLLFFSFFFCVYFLSSFPVFVFLFSSFRPPLIVLLPPEDDVLTWSRIINHANIVQGSGCVPALLFESPVWLFGVTGSEVEPWLQAVSQRCLNAGAMGKETHSCLWKLYSREEIGRSSVLCHTHSHSQTGSRPVTPVTPVPGFIQSVSVVP